MKKWLSAVCGAVMLTSAFAGLTACKEEQVELTMQEVYNANATAKLMQTYEKLGLVKTDAIDGTVEKTYLDGEVYYSSATQGTTILSECYDKAGTLGYVFEGGAYFSLLTTTLSWVVARVSTSICNGGSPQLLVRQVTSTPVRYR